MIDFHAHLDLYPKPSEVVLECQRLDMFVLSVTNTPSAWEGTERLATGVQRVRTALGLHPQLAGLRKHELQLFEQLLPRTRYVGEVGLDGSPEFKSSWHDQVAVFETVLDLCQDAGGKILTIHSRRAATHVLDCIERRPRAGKFVLHWFSGTQRELTRAIDLGCWFSVGPAMLKGQAGRKLVEQMPRERVLTETDGPFVQVSKRAAYPWDATKAAEEIGAIWIESPTSIHRLFLQNLRSLVS